MKRMYMIFCQVTWSSHDRQTCIHTESDALKPTVHIRTGGLNNTRRIVYLLVLVVYNLFCCCIVCFIIRWYYMFHFPIRTPLDYRPISAPMVHMFDELVC